MINYVEKGYGLHQKIITAGYTLVNVDGVWTSDNDVAVQAIIDGYTLADAIAYVKKAIDMHAAELRNRAIAGISPGEMASWGLKLLQAEKYSSSKNKADAPFLEIEALSRGVPIQDLADRVKLNSANLQAIEGTIGGVAGKHKDSVNKKTTFEAVVGYNWHLDWPEV